MKQRRHQLAAGEIARGAENNDVERFDGNEFSHVGVLTGRRGDRL
jgi:hypothetical protein